MFKEFKRWEIYLLVFGLMLISFNVGGVVYWANGYSKGISGVLVQQAKQNQLTAEQREAEIWEQYMSGRLDKVEKTFSNQTEVPEELVVPEAPR